MDPDERAISRRKLFKLAAGTAATAAAGYALERATFGRSRLWRPIGSSTPTGRVVTRTLVGTDGWVSMPDDAVPAPPVWPDPLAPKDRNAYIFGFADAGVVTPNQSSGWADVWSNSLVPLRNHAELCAPILYFTEGDDVRITLWNLGLANRPDLLDAHTIHWHGFPNQVPYFDGVPQSSLSVPIGRNLVYRYLPYVGMAGTYMYHCHVEDAEHVHMGLVGIVFIRPYQNFGDAQAGIPKARAEGGPADSPLGYVFNDGLKPADPGSTAYDREYAFLLTEFDARDHWNDAHFQENDFTEWTPKFFLLNGRSWPDTIQGNTTRARDQVQPSNGVAAMVSSDPRLGSQPWSSLVQANSGETILLRFSNLGYQEHSMELPGIPLRVVGKDAKSQLQGRAAYEENPNDTTLARRDDISYVTHRLELGPGESREVLFRAPDVSTKQVFDFFDRNDGADRNRTVGGALTGGMRTEVHVYPRGTLPPQNFPQQLFTRP